VTRSPRRNPLFDEIGRERRRKIVDVSKGEFTTTGHHRDAVAVFVGRVGGHLSERFQHATGSPRHRQLLHAKT
jgi:hypothetical protein